MKFKALLAAAALAVTSFAAAAPALAYDNDWRAPAQSADFRGPGDDWRFHRSITVVTPRGAYAVQRDDRLFYRLVSRPYNFQPGFRYEYQRCFDRGCTVLVYRGRDPRPVDRIWAPPPPRSGYSGWDNGWQDRGRDGRFDDGDLRGGSRYDR